MLFILSLAFIIERAKYAVQVRCQALDYLDPDLCHSTHQHADWLARMQAQSFRQYYLAPYFIIRHQVVALTMTLLLIQQTIQVGPLPRLAAGRRARQEELRTLFLLTLPPLHLLI